MKRSTIATTALALAASVFAGSSFASVVTNTPVFEDFSALETLTSPHTNLTWSITGDDDNLSAISNATTASAYLYLDTGSGKVTAGIAQAVTNNIVKALGSGDSATFSAKISFYPATAAQELDTDVKFALYALVDNNETNLVAQTRTATNTIGTVTCGVDTTVSVAFTSATEFTVAINGGTPVPGGTFSGEISAIDFQGNGTVDDIAISYTSTMSDGTIEQIGGGSHPLTAKEAEYLNSIVATVGDKAAVEAALVDVSEETFEKASLLNLDVMDSGVEEAIAGTTFKITSIKRSGTKVTVSVALDRPNGSVSKYESGKINGTIALYTSSSPTTGYTKEAAFDLANIRYVNEDMTATNEFTGVTAPFFQVKIED